MEITKMLTLSTAHICEITARRLDNDADDNNLGMCVYNKANFGWFIYLNPRDLDEENSIPKDLFGCLKLAKSLDCDVLCFDCDGPIEPSLPTYEW